MQAVLLLLSITCVAGLCIQCPQDIEDVLAPDAEIKKLTTGMGFTEGPVWLPKKGLLVFSDIPNSKLMQWSQADGLKLFKECEHPNGNLLDLEGRLLTCQHGARNLIRWEADGSKTVLAERFEDKRFNSPNDVAVWSDGTLWFTDPPWGLEKQRAGKELAGHWVFKLDPRSGEVSVLLKNLAMPNGIAFSPDGKRLYIADTGGHRSHPDESFHQHPATVTAYAVGKAGKLSEEPVWQVKARCDGMSVDATGNIYTTGNKRITVFKPDGSLLGMIPVPESPANVCFGGEAFKTLFITARTSLYSIEMSVAGSKPKGR